MFSVRRPFLSSFSATTALLGSAITRQRRLALTPTRNKPILKRGKLLGISSVEFLDGIKPSRLRKNSTGRLKRTTDLDAVSYEADEENVENHSYDDEDYKMNSNIDEDNIEDQYIDDRNNIDDIETDDIESDDDVDPDSAKGQGPEEELHPFIKRLNRYKDQKGLPKSAVSQERMVSGTTNTPFSPEAQNLLRRVSQERGYRSKYWITRPQAVRTANVRVLPGSKPTYIFLHVAKVIVFKNLSKNIQRRILDEHPPYFASGVGILSERLKWRVVTSERVSHLLNPNDEDRALFIDVELAEHLRIKYDRKKDVIDIREASRISLFNAEQLEDPYKGEPQKGVALNAITGKRFGQPAHDILLGVGILRGYISPMWINETQMKYLNLELKPGAEKEGVFVPNMSGMVVSLASIPLLCQRELLKELRATRPDAFGHDLFFLYGVNGWEIMRSKVILKNMAAINDSKYPFHFVNVHQVILQKPQFAHYLKKFIIRRTMPLGNEVMLARMDKSGEKGKDTPSIEDEERMLNEKGKKKKKSELAETLLWIEKSRLALQVGKGEKNSKRRLLFFYAEDVTARKYYNALCTTAPYLATPSVRPVAIVDGRLIGKRDEAVLRAFALKHKLSSPIWLTEYLVKSLGVHILPKHRNDYVRIGAAAAEGNRQVESVEGFYNIEDFPNQSEILSLFPKTSKKVHFMLDAKWRPVIGKQRQEYLEKQKRRTPLWISVNECLMSGFEPRPGTKALSFPSQQSRKRTDKDGKKRESGTILYNSQFTTDPVRVIGLSTVYTRPQGLHV